MYRSKVLLCTNFLLFNFYEDGLKDSWWVFLSFKADKAESDSLVDTLKFLKDR